ncbi:alpha-L-fucosidase [Flavihumibacter petaseus]|uniref:alpha-L-fucosidase n=1 Tax=Flavihumibacter petaseus NBRC 106054 TaxID=1220578 RepID=A0A0E9MYV4_9BACT|nr:alpha-L-fucosidase [Flavihumibacter petaseus]GAO42789.1 putative glycosidase [Flavihumibacter petaseus NBRC 106054]
MINRIKQHLVVGVLALLALSAAAQEKTPAAVIRDFQNRKFGMFIHWGPVSLRGTEIGWSRGDQVPAAEYDSLYKEFDPVLFDADAIAALAASAGMKYLTITARHHDGFCLWPTAFTSYNIKNTPYKKDIVGALAKACRKRGLKFCIYYSVLDWYHPDYPMHSPSQKAPDTNSDMSRYVLFMKNQLKELITQYDPYMLWFDGAWESPWTEAMGRDMYAYLKKLKPDVITNNRLGKVMAGMSNEKIDLSRMVGDYDTPEQIVGKLNMETPWESSFTICKQWAWKPNDPMKSLNQCLSIIAQTVGGNGNLLLNIGPMPDGRVEARQATRLREIGAWLKQNGEAVYNTLGGPYEPNEVYATTRKGNTIFLFVLKTDTASLVLKPIPGRAVKNASIIGGGSLTIGVNGAGIAVPLPDRTDRLPYVIRLELDGSAENLPLIP